MANLKKSSTALVLGGGTHGTVTVDDVLTKGVTIKQGGIVFHIHNTELGNLVRKADLKPSGQRSGADIYTLKDLASVCVPPIWTDEQWEEVLHKGHFPASLKKDFWAAKKARLDYLINAGEYWHTDDVIAAVSELNKNFAMGVRLIPDTLDRLTSLTVEQRKQVTELLDEVMQGVAKTIAETFGEKAKRERIERREELTGEREDYDDL
nr:MAG TPA: Protein of unknown function (DUF1441) [Caudoviricetes sp.]